jgi:hypothetical protein
MDNFPKDILLTGVKLPFSFRRRGWGMRSIPGIFPGFSTSIL